MISLNTRARNAAGAAILAEIDKGSALPNGYLEVRTGSIPASPSNAATGTLLTTVQLSNPAFQPTLNGRAYAGPISNGLIIADGRASWFRIYDRDRNGIIDGSITVTGEDGDLTLSSVDFTQGSPVAINLSFLIPV